MGRTKAAASKGTDQQTLDLMALVAKQKAEIAKAERPNWKTNCSFSYVEGKAVDTISLHVESDVRKLILIAAFLQDKEVSYKRAAADLGIEAPPEFTWGNSSVADWVDDLKTRIAKIQIGAKKKKLETLESRLNLIISPELRAKLELEAIAAELG